MNLPATTPSLASCRRRVGRAWNHGSSKWQGSRIAKGCLKRCGSRRAALLCDSGLTFPIDFPRNGRINGEPRTPSLKGAMWLLYSANAETPRLSLSPSLRFSGRPAGCLIARLHPSCGSFCSLWSLALHRDLAAPKFPTL